MIANAGISVGVKTEFYEDLAQFERVLDTNVLAIATTFHPFIASMKARGQGTLVGIASVAGVRGLPGSDAYCASKAAAIVYCESLRVEMARYGVKVVDDLARLHPYGNDQEESVSDAFLMDAVAFAERAAEASLGSPLPHHPVANGLGHSVAASDATRCVRSIDGKPQAEATHRQRRALNAAHAAHSGSA